jgi:hypothetical protein
LKRISLFKVKGAKPAASVLRNASFLFCLIFRRFVYEGVKEALCLSFQLSEIGWIYKFRNKYVCSNYCRTYNYSRSVKALG